MTRRLAAVAHVCLAVIGLGPMPASAADSPYRLLKEIAIGGQGGWDYLSVDPAARRLYVSHSTTVVVVDLDTNRVTGKIAPTPGVHGIALAPDLGRGFVSNGRDSTVSIVDLKTLRTIKTVATGENPDAILYEPMHREVYAFNGRSKSATVIDAGSGEVRATIPLAGKPEFAVVDESAGRIFVNIEDTSQVVAIDTAKRSVAATWPLAPGQEPTGLALDPHAKRLFVGCSNRLLVMMDSVSGKVLDSVAIGAGVDATAFDPGTGLAFASSGDGTLTVARPEASGTLKVVQGLATPPRSRTMTLDPTTHRLYVAAAAFTTPSPGPGGIPRRPLLTPGSFRVMVYEMVSPAR